MHVCRGNRTTSGGGRGGYEPPSRSTRLTRIHVDRFVLEYDTDRAGGFEPLRFVPKGKVSRWVSSASKNPTLEKQDDLLRRIDQASKYISLDQFHCRRNAASLQPRQDPGPRMS